MKLGDWFSGRVFNFVHGHNLVYNTCWEDPRLDREAMKLSKEDNVLVITSAGCNALDYLLDEPNSVHAVDMNPRQNALLELKVSGIRNLEFEDFYRLFGNGYLPNAGEIYRQKLRPSLSPWSSHYWDRWIRFFDNPRRTFYFRGTSGGFAQLINFYMDKIAKVRPVVEKLFEAGSVEDQYRIYMGELYDRLWTKPICFAMGRDTTLSLLGVPRAQRRQIERGYVGGVVQYIKDCLEAVLAKLPLTDNYFWRVYTSGSYTPECCPGYLKPDSFERLKNGLLNRLEVHTNSVQGYLDATDAAISRYVLLDHMDWLSTHSFPLLEAEWQAILRRATPGARILWRSGGLQTDFVDRVRVTVDGIRRELGELLRYHTDWARKLHDRDRVHTYASFYIADLAA